MYNQRAPSYSVSPPPFSPSPPGPASPVSNTITVHPLSSAPANPPSPVAAPAAPAPPARKKPGRKPKIPLPDAPPVEPKPKRTRKAKDPNAPPIQRRRKNRESLENHPPEIQFAVHPENIYRGPIPAENHPPPFEQPFAVPAEAIPNSGSFFSNGPPPPPLAQQPPPPPPPQQQQQPQQQPPPPQPYPQQQPPPAVRSSGQNYDPIRSNYDPVRANVVSYGSYAPAPAPPQGSPGLPASMNRASASPSISSLVDPPNQPLASPSAASHSFFMHRQQQILNPEHPSVPPSPTANRFAPPPAEPSPPAPAVTTKRAEGLAATPSGPSAVSKKSMASGSTAGSSAAASPKPPKLKDAKDTYPTPPPLPGSGILQLGVPTDGTEFRAPTVIINVSMSGEVNKVVNFTRLAEEQYGWDALHPRAAAQRDRLARVAEVSAALERNGSAKESGDEMSLDSEAEGSNVEMGGMSDGRTGTDGGAKKVVRKRKMKEDEYDKDDGFVDDSELLWEEHAAAAIDGFFVYSGPLVPEVEKPAADTRPDGAPKRGRGRGSRGGTSRASGGRGGSAAASRTGVPLSGPGSRGGSTTRKPRITKADRARMEQEKLEREKMGSMASMPGNYGNMPQLASAANMGNTPMVFNQ